MAEHGTRNGDILPLEIMARVEDWNKGISLYGRKVIVNHSEAFAEELIFTQHTGEVTAIASPFLYLKIQEAQNLMDELWRCGLRPSEGSGSAGSLAATEKHLEDFRKIAFNKLKIEDK